jgi:hypothetical protein
MKDRIGSVLVGHHLDDEVTLKKNLDDEVPAASHIPHMSMVSLIAPKS